MLSTQQFFILFKQLSYFELKFLAYLFISPSLDESEKKWLMGFQCMNDLPRKKTILIQSEKSERLGNFYQTERRDLFITDLIGVVVVYIWHIKNVHNQILMIYDMLSTLLTWYQLVSYPCSQITERRYFYPGSRSCLK